MENNKDGFEINLNTESKVINLVVAGKYVPEKQKKFEEEYIAILKKINPTEYSLVADCTQMNVVSPQHLEQMGAVMKTYKDTGFTNVKIKVSASPILKMQLSRVARMNDVDLEIVLS